MEDPAKQVVLTRIHVLRKHMNAAGRLNLGKGGAIEAVVKAFGRRRLGPRVTNLRMTEIGPVRDFGRFPVEHAVQVLKQIEPNGNSPLQLASATLLPAHIR